MSRRRPSALRRAFVRRQEQLEARLPLTADLALVGQLEDQSINEGGTLDLDFSFTDTLQTSAWTSVGLNPLDFASLGVFDPADPFASIVIDTDALTVSGIAGSGVTVTNAIPALKGGAGTYEIAVFTFDSFDLDDGQTITAVGSRPFAILSLSDITIGGVIDVSADGRIAGPGGGDGAAVNGNFTTQAESAAGSASGFLGGAGVSGQIGTTGMWAGGGGGFGGDGGRGPTSTPALRGGEANGDLSDGIQGGGGGGGARRVYTSVDIQVREGGGGGGGVEFGATGAIVVEATGAVYADGADGQNQEDWDGSGVVPYSGAGGGGGGILMHAFDVSVSGSLTARGGNSATNFASSQSGGGGGGRIHIAYDENGVYDTTGAVIDVSGGLSGTNPLSVSGGADGASGVVTVEETISETTQDNYVFTIELLDALDVVLETFCLNEPVTDLLVNGTSLIGSVSLAGLYNSAFGDDANLKVRVTVSDDQATPNVVSDTFDLLVNNVAPVVLDESDPIYGLEGAPLTASGSFFDVPADLQTLTLSASIGSVVGDGLGGWTWSYTGSDDFVGDVVITADDGDGGVVTSSFDLTVVNVDPAVVTAPTAVVGDEGTLLTAAGSFTDVPADTLTLSASIGSLVTDGLGGWTWSYLGEDDLVDVVVITADDGDGGVASTTFDLSVLNVAPAVVAAPSAVSGDEGTVLTASGSFSDVPADALTITASLGSVTSDGLGGWSWSYTGEDDFAGVVMITADDGDGGVTSTTFDLTVANVDPVVVATPGAVVGDEGSLLTASGSFSDVPADALTITASIGSVVDDGLGGWTWTYTDADDFAGVVTITAEDGDGGSASTTFDLTVANVAPVLTSVVSDGSDFGAKKAGQTVTLNAAFTDAGVLDTHTLSIDWGDGTTSTIAAGSAGAAAATHAYAEAGFYDVTVTLTDDDGGVTTATTQSIISGVALHDGVLIGIGTNGADKFQVYRIALLNKVYVISDLAGCSPLIYQFNAGDVSSAELYLGGGNDIGFISSAFNKSAYVDGGAGNDLLTGGSANDILLGGAGNDILFGGGGRDLLIGGTGLDLLFAEGGDDVLISGDTLHDGDRVALDAILAEWGSNRSYNERVDNLIGDLNNSGNGLNGDYFLIASGEDQTVFDDEDFDLLVGGGGRDLYFAGECDISLANGLEQVFELEAMAPTA